MNAAFRENFETQLINTFDDALSHLTRMEPSLHSHWKEIVSALIYPLAAGGKRVRPTILGYMAEACGASMDLESIVKASCAIELIHTYSLVHDDLPCMDNDDFRRGQPTTHKVFGEANALLVGDALLTHSFSILADLPSNELPARSVLECTRILARCSGAQGMIAGQWLDLAFENEKGQCNWTTLQTIHTLKTGALLSASFSIGLVLGCALSSSRSLRELSVEKLRELISLSASVGLKVGLAFQIIDDILDVTQTSMQLGKTAGKDPSQNKLTAVKLLGLENATARAEELTKRCLEEIDLLQTTICTLSAQQINERSFTPVRHFVAGLLSRTS